MLIRDVTSVSFQVLDGFLKIGLFIFYLLAISRMKDIQVLFQYHGAEHKVIHAFEAGAALTVDQAKKYSLLHPRCGTAFIVLILVSSIVIFSLIIPMFATTCGVVQFSKMSLLTLKILLILPISGIAYECIRQTSREKSSIISILVLPGLFLQRLTTREPNDDQIEVALEALKKVL